MTSCRAGDGATRGRLSGQSQVSYLGLEWTRAVHHVGQLYCPDHRYLDLKIELKSNMCHRYLVWVAPSLEKEKGMIHGRCWFCFVFPGSVEKDYLISTLSCDVTNTKW